MITSCDYHLVLTCFGRHQESFPILSNFLKSMKKNISSKNTTHKRNRTSLMIFMKLNFSWCWEFYNVTKWFIKYSHLLCRVTVHFYWFWNGCAFMRLDLCLSFQFSLKVPSDLCTWKYKNSAFPILLYKLQWEDVNGLNTFCEISPWKTFHILPAWLALFTTFLLYTEETTCKRNCLKC